MNIAQLLDNKIRNAMTAAGVPENLPALVVPSTNVRFGDYQANGALGAAKKMGMPPRDLADAITAHLDLEGIAHQTEIAGPGFINIHLSWAFLASLAGDLYQNVCAQQGRRAPDPDKVQTIVVDYSSPNLAKEMHVGHLRSTIIGDAVARILEYQGHRVIRQNHMGDWGTQFGMLIAELEEHLGQGEQPELALHDLERFYQQAKTHFDTDADFANKAREYVVKLQSGDSHCQQLWQQFIDISIAHSEAIYRQLNVTLQAQDIRPESAYNDDLALIVSELKASGLAVEDAGATVVFLDELADKKGNPSPVIVQKSDGGYLYATTDLAALRYRADVLKADAVLYFIDARQSLHMNQVFTLARKAGFVGANMDLQYLPFGTMMGEDGKPFKTRSGGTVKLNELLLEAIDRAGRLVAERSADLSDEERSEVAHKVGIGAVKYADLSITRTNDYVFSWEQMLSFEGNTAPYLQYAYTRVRSLFRRAGLDSTGLSGDVVVSADAEKALVLHILEFEATLGQVSEKALPHILCTYLYDLASKFMSFYEQCPVLGKDVDEAIRNSRLQICALAAETIRTGLELLGIETMERM